MMKKSILKIAFCFALCSFSCVTLAAPALTNTDYSGVQLRQMQEQMERERIERQMQEHREKQKESIEDQQQKPSGQKGAVRFALHSVEIDESQILLPEKRNEIVAPYIGREVTLDDLYEIVKKSIIIIRRMAGSPASPTCRRKQSMLVMCALRCWKVKRVT